MLPRGAIHWVLTALVGLGCGHSRRAPARGDVADAPRAPARATRYVEHRERCRPSGCCGGPSVCGLVPLECSALFTVLTSTGPSGRDDAAGTQAAERPDGSLGMLPRTGDGPLTPEPERLATRDRIEREARCQRSSAGCLGARPTAPTSPPPRAQASPAWRVVTRGVRIGIVPAGAPDEAATWIHEERAGTEPIPRYRVEGSAIRRDGGLVVISVEAAMSRRVVLVRLDDAQHPVGRPVLVGIASRDVEALDCGAEGPCVLTLRGERGDGAEHYALSLPPLTPLPERDPPAPWDGRCRIDP